MFICCATSILDLLNVQRLCEEELKAVKAVQLFSMMELLWCKQGNKQQEHHKQNWHLWLRVSVWILSYLLKHGQTSMEMQYIREKQTWCNYKDLENLYLL